MEDVNFSATTVVRNWSSYHDGLSIVFKHGHHQEMVLFFEDGGDINVHDKTISDFMAAIGSEFRHDSIQNLQAEMFARPTLQYIAESNGVSEWNDNTATHIVNWYYESDPHFIEKYPQFEENPEFMLEPHGNRPLKEMYWRPFFDGAGLSTVASTGDAQRLLDHLLALRYPESGDHGAALVAESNDVMDTSRAYAPSVADAAAFTVEADAGRKDDGSTGSFWTFDDMDEP